MPGRGPDDHDGRMALRVVLVDDDDRFRATARRLKADGSRPTVTLVSSRDASCGRRVSSGLAVGVAPKDQLTLAAILAATGGAP